LSSIAPFYFSRPWAYVNTKYRIHRVLHIPKTNFLPLRTCLSSLIPNHSVDPVGLNSLHSHDYKMINK
jgi:hypothetical protein